MKKLTCIVCPSGCSLEIEESGSSQGNISVTGNKCKRGIDYAIEEIREPKRTVTATCPIEETSENKHFSNLSIRRVPVKTVQPCPKEKIPALIEDIYKTKISLPVKMGDIVIKNWNEQGIDVIATRTINSTEQGTNHVV